MCEELNTVRGKMLHYMQSLRMSVGYVSLKIRNFEQQNRNFPPLRSRISGDNSNSDAYDVMDSDEKAGDEEVLLTNSLEEKDPLGEVFPTSPLEEKDRRISSLTKQVEELRNEVSEVTELKESLTKAKAKLKIVNNLSTNSKKRLSYAKNVTEQRMVEAILTETPHEVPHLASIYSATLNEDEFEMDESSNLIKPLSDNFLKKVEENCDLSNETQKERLNNLKNQILEKVKLTRNRRDRSRSTGSTGSSFKRSHENPSPEKRSPTRPRLNSPI